MKKLYGMTIPLDIYCADLRVYYGDPALMNEFAKKYYGMSKEMAENESLNLFGGYNYFGTNNKTNVPDFIYIGKTKNNFGIICHECLHYCLFLFNVLGIYLNKSIGESHEPLTYLIAYIVSKIQKGKWSEYDFKNKKWK